MKVFYLAVCWGSLAALPQVPIETAGDADFVQPNPNTLQVVAGDRTIIDWSEFSIGESERAEFIQPSATASVVTTPPPKGLEVTHIFLQPRPYLKAGAIRPKGSANPDPHRIFAQ